MPPDGGIVSPKNVHVEPLFSEINLDASLNGRVLGGLMRSNGLPRGHTDLNGGHPGLRENFLEGVLVPEVSPTSLRP
jgi:hypothetical protein